MNLKTEFTSADFVILMVVKKMKNELGFLKQDNIFWPLQNFANADYSNSAICLDIYTDICYMPMGLARVTTGSVCCLLYWNQSSNYNILVLLRKAAITTTFSNLKLFLFIKTI